MKTQIEIIQREDDKTDYLAKIVQKLNNRFTTQEQMEMSYEMNCLEIAQELGCEYSISLGMIVFNFSHGNY